MVAESGLSGPQEIKNSTTVTMNEDAMALLKEILRINALIAEGLARPIIAFPYAGQERSDER